MKHELIKVKKGRASWVFRILPTIEIAKVPLHLSELTKIEFGFLWFYVSFVFAEGVEND